MKFRIMLKDPDGIGDALMDAAKKSLAGNTFFDTREAKAAHEERLESIKDRTDKWIEYGDYVTVEFDTDAGTAVVVEVGK